MMWILILLATLVVTGAGIVYLVNRFQQFSFVKQIHNKKNRIFVAILILLALGVGISLFMGILNCMISIIYLTLFWLLCDGIAWIFVRKKEKRFIGLIAIAVTVAYLGCGWYFAHHVWEKDYIVGTNKIGKDLRVVQFADSHIGTTFHQDGFAKHMTRIQSKNPDVILITGDFVDDGTTKEDMVACCEVLGNMKTTYGIYFSFGNHDKGYYDGRDFSGDDLVKEFEKNGIVVLQDETVLLNDEIYIIGRKDRSEEERGLERATMNKLVDSLDPSKYMIVMDHQPNDYENQAKSGVDLVLSGHTHGGQLIPITYVGEWIGANDRTYGYEKRKNTDFIVTSGISDWEIKFKTGCKSEFVVIDIVAKNK